MKNVQQTKRVCRVTMRGSGVRCYSLFVNKNKSWWRCLIWHNLDFCINTKCNKLIKRTKATNMLGFMWFFRKKICCKKQNRNEYLTLWIEGLWTPTRWSCGSCQLKCSWVWEWQTFMTHKSLSYWKDIHPSLEPTEFHSGSLEPTQLLQSWYLIM